MNCQEFQAHLPAYVDGELGVDETLAAGSHVAECGRCRSLAERERQFRQLLRRQPRESAPPEFRARLIAAGRREARRAMVGPWLVAPGVAAAAAVALALVLPAVRQPAPLVGDLVAAHAAYAEIERPAEFASADRDQVEGWFLERARLRVTVPDYSPGGIRLVGGRIAEVHGRKAAYVLYEKGHNLLSVFVLPGLGEGADLKGTRVTYRGREYVTLERNGYRTVSWTDGQTTFGLVSLLDYEALLECADRLWEERASRSRL